MMTYKEFMARQSFDLEHLIAMAYGKLVEDPPEFFDARLPAPPFLMVDRILSMTAEGRGGHITAELNVKLDSWYFQCHMPGDPVQPGCLSVDGVWQLLGFYCAWRGGLGTGRALGCGEVSFNGQIRPYNRLMRYEIDVRRFQMLKDAGAGIVIGDANIFIDGELIATVKQARTGVFKGLSYRDYPRPSANSLGGIVDRSA